MLVPECEYLFLFWVSSGTHQSVTYTLVSLHACPSESLIHSCLVNQLLLDWKITRIIRGYRYELCSPVNTPCN